MPELTLLDLITSSEARALKYFVAKHLRDDTHPTVHNIVMKWLDSRPKVMERFAQHGVIKTYGAYLLEYKLNLK